MERKKKPKATGWPGLPGLCSLCSPPAKQHSAITALCGHFQQEGEVLSQGTCSLPEIHDSAGSVQELCGFAVSNNFSAVKMGFQFLHCIYP